jgi:hypothetical protein
LEECKVRTFMNLLYCARSTSCHPSSSVPNE